MDDSGVCMCLIVCANPLACSALIWLLVELFNNNNCVCRTQTQFTQCNGNVVFFLLCFRQRQLHVYISANSYLMCLQFRYFGCGSEILLYVFLLMCSDIVASTTLAIAIYTNCNRDKRMQNNLDVIQRTPFIISIQMKTGETKIFLRALNSAFCTMRN